MAPRASIRFVADRTLPRQLRQDPQFRAFLADRAQDVASTATSNGRVVNKTYRAEVTTGPEGLPRVEADALPRPRNASYGGVASYIEWGTVTNRAYAPLRNAVVTAGLTLSDGSGSS